LESEKNIEKDKKNKKKGGKNIGGGLSSTKREGGNLRGKRPFLEEDISGASRGRENGS